ncbi:MAG: DUF929 family protein [Candidatus Micrarchaeota archaeon]|nr:DUF929 family protein [Candidatus Micrarchaeota archaeon]MDE1848151.1 DUF929 family protein [Candidatus Micrarchaeota archaeon]MDE1864111.1 DUF929 family protein [Candidatus Micrarchaeota archaeon]
MNKRNLAIVIVIALVVVAALIWTALQNNSGAAFAALDNVQVGQAFLDRLTSIPNSTFASVGVGAAGGSIKKISNSPELTLGGKPEVLYIGAEFCPYCAAERWPMIIALSRFGTFGKLHYMTSSSSDRYPNTPSFTFYNSTYTSDYVAFVPVELTTNRQINGTYPTLQTTNATEQQIGAAFSPNGQVSFPFVDFGNRSVLSGSTYSPQVLSGMNWTQILGQIYQSNSTISQSVVGSANLLTAQICLATNNTPSRVCSQAYIQRIEKLFG